LIVILSVLVLIFYSRRKRKIAPIRHSVAVVDSVTKQRKDLV